jgi:predicted nucleic acid-binding protein
MSVVYDAGALIAADDNDRRMWADHRVRLELGVVPTTTAPVVAQVSRSPRQVLLRRFLRGCEVLPFDAGQAHEVGALLGRAGRADVVDAHVALTAAATGSTVLTSDPSDLAALAAELPTPIHVRTI